MAVLLIATVALLASALTFFSGFGLGTLLLPAFAFFYPIDLAIASTAVVHFLNGLFKLALVGRHADRETVLRFGLPAIGAAFLGGWLLLRFATADSILSYNALGIEATVRPATLVVGLLLLLTTLLEFSPAYKGLALPPKYVPLGGALSGFFGGLSGMQGALRSAFLLRLGLSKEAFIGTGVVVAILIDTARLGAYAHGWRKHHADLDLPVLLVAVLSAFLGAAMGHRFLEKVTLRAVQRIVGIMLLLVSLAMIAGLV